MEKEGRQGQIKGKMDKKLAGEEDAYCIHRYYILRYILASFLMNIKSHFKIEFLIRLFAVVNTLFDIFYMHLRR